MTEADLGGKGYNSVLILGKGALRRASVFTGRTDHPFSPGKAFGPKFGAQVGRQTADVPLHRDSISGTELTGLARRASWPAKNLQGAAISNESSISPTRGRQGALKAYLERASSSRGLHPAPQGGSTNGPSREPLSCQVLTRPHRNWLHNGNQSNR